MIHRHKITNENLALEIEAAVMDCFPGLTNRISGHGSGDFGPRSAAQISREYGAKEFVPKHEIILINTPKSDDRSVYEATRGVWKIDPKRAGKCLYVLAHRDGIVCAVFKPSKWVKATPQNFSWLQRELPRWGFEGTAAPEEVAEYYLDKRVPSYLRKKGAANPIRFVSPPDN